MNTVERIRTAAEYVEWLRQSLQDRELPSDDRGRAAAACFAIVQDHHHAITVLQQQRLYASGFALLRVAFEAYVRGEWLANCATEVEIRCFIQGKEPPRIGQLIAALENTPAFDAGALSATKLKHWDTMCAYTHTGGLHIQRWVTAEAIEPSYTPKEIQEVLFFAELVSTMSALGIACLVNDDLLAESIFRQFKERLPP